MFWDKIIIITWASDGLWKAISKRFISLWAIVIGIGKNNTKLNKTSQELWANFHAFQCDLRNKEELDKTYNKILQQFPIIDILINNAGIWYEWSIVEHNLNVLQDLIMTNIFSVMWSIYKIFPSMQKNKSGQILNINSTSWIDICKDRAPYSWTKFAITWYTKWLSEEARQYGIKVMQLYPGWMNTNIFETYQQGYGIQEWMMDKEKIVDLIIQMLSQPEDIIIDNMIVRKF